MSIISLISTATSIVLSSLVNQGSRLPCHLTITLLFVVLVTSANAGFIQANMSKIQGLFNDF